MGIREVQEGKMNCSTIFLLPGIGLQRRDILSQGFIGAFIDDINHELHYQNAVYMVFRPDNKDAFEVFLTKEYKRANIMEDYDYADGYVVVVYRFDRRFDSDFEKFKVGKYSEFSKRYKDLFPKKVAITNEDGKVESHWSLQHLIFMKSGAIKDYWEEKIGQMLEDDVEFWPSPYIERDETLNIRDLKK